MLTIFTNLMMNYFNPMPAKILRFLPAKSVPVVLTAAQPPSAPHVAKTGHGIPLGRDHKGVATVSITTSCWKPCAWRWTRPKVCYSIFANCSDMSVFESSLSSLFFSKNSLWIRLLDSFFLFIKNYRVIIS